MRILVVDDNVDSARGLAKILSLLGHETAVVHAGRDALDAAHRHDPAVVLLDIGLPDIDGYEVARQLRADEKTRGVLLIAVSGYGQERDRIQAADARFDHHFIKPLDIEGLLRVVEKHAVEHTSVAGRTS